MDHIAKKISKSLSILNKIKDFLPTKIMLGLYYSLIHPYIFYAIESWFCAQKYLTNKHCESVLYNRKVFVLYTIYHIIAIHLLILNYPILLRYHICIREMY